MKPDPAPVRCCLRRGLLLALAVVLPKCAACAAGYLALAAGISAATPELCGGAVGPNLPPAPWWLAGPFVLAGSAVYRRRTPAAARSATGCLPRA